MPLGQVAPGVPNTEGVRMDEVSDNRNCRMTGFQAQMECHLSINDGLDLAFR